jgi:5-formyltetrahydrofolate cyclo-ligase
MDNSDIIAQKKAVRQENLIKRAKLNPSYKTNYDQWICEQLAKIVDERNYHNIHVYLPMGKEINITPLIETLLAKNKTVVAPKTLPKRKLQNLVLTAIDDVEKGVFGTTHPASGKVYEGPFDLIIVPGLAFDNHRYRVGYGGGYYDNFLVQHPEAQKIGIFYPQQAMENVPREPHDMQLDELLVNEDLTLENT